MVDLAVLFFSAGLFVRIDRRLSRNLKAVPTKHSDRIDIFFGLIAACCLVSAGYSSIRIAGKVIVLVDKGIEQVRPYYQQAENFINERF